MNATNILIKATDYIEDILKAEVEKQIEKIKQEARDKLEKEMVELSTRAIMQIRNHLQFDKASPHCEFVIRIKEAK